MRENLGEHITIDDMARTAMFSKFHFSRVFLRVTGVSPGRFLSAMRLQEAKRLLVATSLSVTDISHRVGYSSVGTFSSRFRASVGVSPTMYRRLGGFTSRICVDGRRPAGAARQVDIRGHVRPPLAGRAGLVFIGLFPDRLPQGNPVRCSVLAGPGPYVLEMVPQGTWHVLAYSPAMSEADEYGGVDGDAGFEAAPAQSEQDYDGFVGVHGPLVVRAEMPARPVDLRLRPANALDPPVLLAVLDQQPVTADAQLG
ncbi:AraC-like DNA-binding protein [Actinokineospora baliensis]|uniref:helix-turn-helix domain-containing protein n=1 Tax=Actinokineospora baliensis TaxID=547056 RepID=UPI001EF7B663|nr:AraC family transcriptional regulator [Actinokineospora baliensis]MBM7774514.1 AraC-like DNA-binding protein [Actinokineospora baliensis]